MAATRTMTCWDRDNGGKKGCRGAAMTVKKQQVSAFRKKKMIRKIKSNGRRR